MTNRAVCRSIHDSVDPIAEGFAKIPVSVACRGPMEGLGSLCGSVLGFHVTSRYCRTS